MLLQLIPVLLGGIALGNSTFRIHNANEFVAFSNAVNNGANHNGTTVFLDSDLSLSEITEPIGKYTTNYFLGVFDGQGHIISDFKMNPSTSSRHTGLFGYSKGLTIRNVVLDSSCSITNSYSGSVSVYIGGIFGECEAGSKECNIENSVNMADVTFSGTIDTDDLNLGGIAGYLESSGYPIYVKNCANYGSVTHSGKVNYYSYIGGIAGHFYGSSSHYVYIYNSLNYGTITYNSSSTSGTSYLGGITGYSNYARIENCVSAGKISTQNIPSSSNIGSIVGFVNSYTFINYCYYTSDLSELDLYAYSTPSVSSVLSYDNTTFELNGAVSVGSYTGTSLVSALNAYSDYYNLRDYSKWLLNMDSKTVNFTINSRASPTTMDSQVILLPSLASEGNLWFDGWYNDDKYTHTLESFEIIADKTLYGRFEENTKGYTISFETRREGVSVAPITAQFGAVVSLPSDSIREHCSVAFWETGYGDNVGLSLTMPGRNITLYAVWKCTHITRIDDFTDFSMLVNTGIDDYNGTTVYLDSDLSLLEITELIGKDNNHFRGVFDGQGHVISGLKMNSSSSQYTGLFGYSHGLTIKNVVLDSSCSITNSFSGSISVYIGGIIGDCYVRSGGCNIENSVNMADVTFSGYISNTLYLGGIAGRLSSSGNPIHVKNCANYGSVTHSGVSSYSYVGGIAGYLSGSTSYVYNSLNYGTITESGSSTPGALYIGGIAGHSFYAYIENCVSAGKESTQNIPSSSNIGSIVGFVNSYTFINYCYYTSDLSEFKLYGYAYSTPSVTNALSYDNTTFELSGTVSVGSYTGTSLISALNAAADYYILRDYSKWLFNKDSKTVNFTINSRTSSITMNYQVILLPSLASEGKLWFDGWYNDNGCTQPLESFEITEDKTFYGRFEENTKGYTISFETRREGVSVGPITAQFGAVVQLPSDSIREHCSVAFWETGYGDNVGLSLAMPARNITLYAVWKCTHIATVYDFVDFSEVVNTGIDVYNGETVYLDSDLSLPEITEPINYFLGVFDGQGHIVSDLTISTSSEYTGLFGGSDGLTIRNVVLDSSCSITSTFSGSSSVYVGGIVGDCEASSRECNIENSVNMADVTFNGIISAGYTSLFLGGIAGRLYSPNYHSYVKNCANYGSVTHSGKVSAYSYIGGIVGYLFSPNLYYIYIYNCLNYGAITHSGTPLAGLYIGGITGYGHYTYIENCVSAGKISTQNTSSSNYIGSIVGYVNYQTYINQCYYYYTSDAGEFAINGTIKPTNIPGTPNTTTPVDMTLINSLNDYASKNSTWNRWFLNTNNASVSLTVNYGKGFTVNSQVILLPDPVDNNERTFSGWYSDPYCLDLFQSDEVTESTTLYGLYGVVATVAFDANGGNVEPASKKVALDSIYGTLPNANRTGYMFVGWFTEKDNGTEATSETIANTTTNVTLYAHWIKTSNYVEVVFNAKNLTKKDVEKLLKQYTDAEFSIFIYEISDSSDEIKVIIKFISNEEADNFIETINSLSEMGNIKKVRLITDDVRSFSSLPHPILSLITSFLFI